MISASGRAHPRRREVGALDCRKFDLLVPPLCGSVRAGDQSHPTVARSRDHLGDGVAGLRVCHLGESRRKLTRPRQPIAMWDKEKDRIFVRRFTMTEAEDPASVGPLILH